MSRSQTFLSGLCCCLLGLIPLCLNGQETEKKETSDSPAVEKPETKDGPPLDAKADSEEPEKKPETKEQRRARYRRNATVGMGGFTNLVSIPQIQAELKLTDTQRLELNNQIKRSRIALRKMYSEVQDLPRNEQGARMAEIRVIADGRVGEREQELKKVLTEEQLGRINGISLQLRGAQALLDPELIEKLKLTEEQVEEIYRLTEENERATIKLMRERRGARREGSERPRGPVKGVLHLRDELYEQVLAVLTDEQKGLLEKMKGESYAFSPQSSRRRPTPADSDPEKKKSESKPQP